ncbi:MULTISPECIES: hypothetical protein [unclassified Thiomonas]|jgi:hypothetical protein|uniref:hypothetical protein n=1 Tax=unclassified Thiomonas TaxID=2625466 RepID=UPI000BD415DE|nr:MULTISPECIES: hypothetical protein [unclassified Thiomonas]OZB72200.1 MAG: hypothetical protein B7X30_01020 [Thiomonas sp. 13-64-67]
MHDALKMTPAQRAERAADKRHTLLRFLRDEVYTTAPIAAVLLGLSERQTARTLAGMQRAELLASKRITTDSGWAPVLWGITPHGQGMAFDPSTGEIPGERTFEPARVALSTLKHALGLQRLRVQAHAAGWTDWQSGDRLAPFDAEARPDAISTDTQGVRWCIEYERTMKRRSRYERILFTRLRAIREGKYSRVVWVCDDSHTASLLRGMLTSLREFDVKHAGQKQRVTIDPARHHPLLSFTSIDQFPTTTKGV